MVRSLRKRKELEATAQTTWKLYQTGTLKLPGTLKLGHREAIRLQQAPLRNFRGKFEGGEGASRAFLNAPRYQLEF